MNFANEVHEVLVWTLLYLIAGAGGGALARFFVPAYLYADTRDVFILGVVAALGLLCAFQIAGTLWVIAPFVAAHYALTQLRNART